MSNNERFSALFSGFTERYGRYDIYGGTADEEKVQGRARTVDETLTQKEYDLHLAGEVGIGVIPLRSDDRVNFAAIDIDIYKQDDRKARNLTHEDVALAMIDTPLITSRSKSNGIHLWLFSKEGVQASLATDYLNAQAAILGVAGTEVFPKQTRRASPDDVGNWINLPYFGGERVAVFPNRKPGGVTEFVDADLDVFLKVAEGESETVTDDWLISNTNPGVSQRDDGDDEMKPMFTDGPPCLQSLIVGHPERRATIQRKFDRGEITEDQFNKQMTFTHPQLDNGNRNNTFFNVGVYLRRRLKEYDQEATLTPDEKKDLSESMVEAHTLWCVARGIDPTAGIKSELPTLTAQAAKGKWGYACTKEPLKGHCNRRLCLKRKFGIGTTASDSGSEITNFTVVESKDRQYYMDVFDKRIHIADSVTLYSQTKFGEQVLAQADTFWQNIAEPKYREMMNHQLKTAVYVKPPAESDRREIMLNALLEFIDKKKIAKDKNDSSIFSGRVILSEDGTEARFKLDQFEAWLRARGISWSTHLVTQMLRDDFGVVGRGSTHIGGRQIRPYLANLVALDEAATALAAEMAGDGEA